MIMTQKLAESLMNNLVALAISANGGYPQGGMTKEQIGLVNNYARNKFLEIVSPWEEITGEMWEIVK